jgi:ribosome biogenesis protein UTP30
LPAIVSRIRDGWENIQNLHIKTSNSTSLPIWTCDLGDGPEGRWHGLTHTKEEEWGGIEPGGLGDSESPSSGSPPLSKPPKRKGADEDHPSKIAKKARGEAAETTLTTPSSKPKSKAKSSDKPPSTPVFNQARSISTADVTAPSIDSAKKLGKLLKEPPAKERSHKAVVSKPYDKKPKSKAVDIAGTSLDTFTLPSI